MTARPAVLVIVAALVLTGCGGSSDDATLQAPAAKPPASPSPSPSPFPSPSPSPTPSPKPTSPHFDSPEAAMRYLADAWNRRDIVKLKHVTDPKARAALDAMHREATNLQLDKCTFQTERRDYLCVFTHDYPASYKTTKKHGTAGFTVGPADRPGWYMTVLEWCG